MKQYENLKLEIFKLQENDIVTASLGSNDVDVEWSPGWDATPGWYT